MTSRAIAMTIAGSDPSGGAGIQADLKTFTALGVYGASVLTALTAQNSTGVTAIHKLPSTFVTAQFDAVTSDLAVGAVKTGMLADAETVQLVAGLIKRWSKGPVVVDPVMVATSGDLLLEPEAVESVKRDLLPLAMVATPNVPEAAALLGAHPAKDEPALIAQGKALLDFGSSAVLIKGGHGEGESAVDFLITRDNVRRFELPRIMTRNTHGTGCTLSAAIVAQLARGAPLEAAVDRAKSYVWQALKSGAELNLGKGCGPLDHVFAVAHSVSE